MVKGGKMRNNKDRVLKIVEYISALTLILIIFDCKNVLSQFIRINNDNAINIITKFICIFIITYIMRNVFLDNLKIKTFNGIDELLITLVASFFLYLKLRSKLCLRGVLAKNFYYVLHVCLLLLA